MKACQTLPEGYHECLRVGTQDKKTALIINALGLVLMAAVLCLGSLAVPLREFLHPEDYLLHLLQLGVYLAGFILYIILHELTHAAVMRAVGGGKVRFGFTGLYAFAGSDGDWFDKPAYLCIALAPVVLWSILFCVLAAAVPRSWFWAVWLLQASNVGGAGGDLYVSVRFLRMSPGILIRDTGTEMTVYDRTGSPAAGS